MVFKQTRLIAFACVKQFDLQNGLFVKILRYLRKCEKQ